MIALAQPQPRPGCNLYVGENSLANHLSSPKGSACATCVQMSLQLVTGVTVPGNQDRTAPRLWLCSRRRDPTGTRQHVLRSLRAPAVTHGGTLIDRLWV